MFLLLLAHSIPLFITTLIDRNIENLATNECADIPTNKANQNLVASKVVGFILRAVDVGRVDVRGLDKHVV